jgi:alpha-glucosidase
MNRIAACCLALSLCVFAVGSYSVLPTLRNSDSQPIRPDPDEFKLAILADLPSQPAAEQHTSQNVPQNVSTDAVALPSATLLGDAPEVAELPPAQENPPAPALAPAIKTIVLPTVALPTVTPTPPVMVVEPSTLSSKASFTASFTASSTSPSVADLNNSADGCWVVSPPASLGLDPFYTKYCSALGIPIVASAEVPDRALQRAWAIVTQMLNGISQAEEIRNSIIRTSTRIGIIGATQVTTDMPEHRSLYTLFPGVDWNTRTRGVGATLEIPLLSIAEENLLCYPSDLWIDQNVLVHEFAHTIKNMGFDLVDPTFHAEVQRTYQHALDTGLWPDTYAISNIEEYWAEGVRLYYQLDAASAPEGQPYPANSRAELEQYDPELYRLVENIFGPHDGISSCQ